jgi:hypothetical protein
MALQIGSAWQTAWEGTAQRLFRPFDGRKWLWLAFSAWLATLLEGGGGSFNVPMGGDDDAEVASGVARAGQWLSENLGCVLAVAVPLVIFFLALVVALTYLKARAEFVFLDQVVGDHTRFDAPWHAYRRQGISVFLWRWAVVGVVLLAMGILVLVGILLWLPARGAPAMGPGHVMRILLTVPILLLFLFLVLAAVLAEFFLKSFVIPLMARHGLRAVAAWRRFLPLLKAEAGGFALYTLVACGLWLAIGTAILFAGCMTCCIGFLILALPWIGKLPLLPVLVFFRLFSVAFLGQLGAEYDLLGTPPPAALPAP